MARSIWSGHLTFGLVSIPVGLHSAVEASEHVSFRLLHRKDHAPIRYKKFCSKEDIEVPADEIVRGYEVQKGKYAVVEGEELAAGARRSWARATTRSSFSSSSTSRPSVPCSSTGRTT